MSKWPGPRPIEKAPKKNDVLGWCSVFPATEMDWRRIRYDGREWFIVGTLMAACNLTHFLPMPPNPEVRK